MSHSRLSIGSFKATSRLKAPSARRASHTSAMPFIEQAAHQRNLRNSRDRSTITRPPVLRYGGLLHRGARSSKFSNSIEPAYTTGHYEQPIRRRGAPSKPLSGVS
jgi:hypothetical protein